MLFAETISGKPLTPSLPMSRSAGLRHGSLKLLDLLRAVPGGRRSGSRVQGFKARTLVGRILSASDGERVAEGRFPSGNSFWQSFHNRPTEQSLLPVV